MMVSIENGKISTDLFEKETAKAQYLDPNSCHAGHQSKSIPYSLAYRIRRICSNGDQFELRLAKLEQDLLNRNYHYKIIEEAFNKIRLVSRETALQKVIREKNEREVLALEYHPALPSVTSLVKKHWQVMVDNNQSLKECFPKPSLVGYRRGKNLKDELVRAKVTTKRRTNRIKNGYKACGQGCQNCWVSLTTTTHSCPRTKRKWKITSPINCATTNVIYKITCSKHPMWVGYIGETKRQLRTRIAEHRSSLKRKVKNAVGKHFCKGHGKNPEAFLRVTGIEKVRPEKNDQLRKIRESRWINLYHSTKFGANIRD